MHQNKRPFIFFHTLKNTLDQLHRHYHRRDLVHPDPLEFLYRYNDIKDREIVGLIASCLAYGRVAQILKSVDQVLGPMNPSPYRFLKHTSFASIRRMFKTFKHRFACGEHMASLLSGIKDVTARFGSLEQCFISGVSLDDETTLSAMTRFVQHLRAERYNPAHLIAGPEKGSACKRLNLFLRWMVRKDLIDPGGWDHIPLNKLIIPLDTHMHRISLLLGLTSRKQANMKTALEVTSGFRKLAPDDPLKYDFCLTRFGIRNDMDICELERYFSFC
ncbi:TIGR02757 family protein [Thermodesulfobacteriota bacterium]